MQISSAEILGTYIPNILAAVKGESSVYDKIKPYLIESEYWLNNNIADSDVVAGLEDDSSALNAIRRIICLDAFYNAVPSLDLVLTPNGFGVVSNQNVAPASKERVANLRKSLIENRDLSITVALSYLHLVEAWRTSLLGKKFGMHLFQNIGFTEQINDDGCPSWATWQRLLPGLHHRQKKYEEKVIGRGLMQSLCTKILEGTTSAVEDELIQMLTDDIIEYMVEPGRVSPHSCEEIVQFIRENTEETFTAWESSDVAKQWEDNSFQNDKNSGGYWL